MSKSVSKKNKNIAYFCAEYGMEEDIPIYAGGLGILAGDMVRETGRRDDIDFYAIGLFTRKGMKTVGGAGMDYTNRLIATGYTRVMKATKLILLKVPVGQNVINVCAWTKKYGNTTVFLLDTDVTENDSRTRRIVDYLYNDEHYVRIAQEMILGIGGNALLEALNIDANIYHFNEGHTSFGALSTILNQTHKVIYRKISNSFKDRVQAVADRVVASKHTILPGAGIFLSKTDFFTYLGPYVEKFGRLTDEIFKIGSLSHDPNVFSTTKFLMNVSGRSNGVSVSHVEAEKRDHTDSKLVAITNGIDIHRWQSPLLFADDSWQKDDNTLREIKDELRSEMIQYINHRTGSRLNSNVPTIVWARRFASYKRPELLFNNPSMLADILNNPNRPLQIVISGKAHVLDEKGTKALNIINDLSKDPRFRDKLVYLPEYSTVSATVLVRGADIWLNTPIPGFEACGTSGMKAASNGGIAMSTRDGWVSEVGELGELGYLIEEENIESGIYEILKNKVIPDLYNNGKPGSNPSWINKMRQSINIGLSRFSASRMVDDYINLLYNS